MAFNLPLESGGNIFTALGALNDNEKKRLENKYYAPNMESSIENRNALTEGYKIQNKYMPDKLRLANSLAVLQNQYYAPNIQSEINNRNALANRYNVMTPLEARELQLKNKFYPELTNAQIQNYKMGGRGGLGVGAKDDLLFSNSLAQDNPQLSPEDLRIANDMISQGSFVMPDGRPINISAATQRALDRTLKSTTTAAVLTSGVKANQAEAELAVLNDYAQKGLKPYGDTLLNMSPEQVMDSFKKDKESQTRLGKFIASQALQYEAAQNRIRLANGQPGVTSTEELMRLSGQMVNAKYPELSYIAREEAARQLDEALKKGLEARRSVGFGASTLKNKPHTNASGKATLRYNPMTGDFEELK